MKLLIAYLILINLVGLISMFSDKRRAIDHRWRISQRALFLIALAGGSLGSTAGMWLFHHKTRHWYFVVGMPAILAIQLFLLYRLVC